MSHMFDGCVNLATVNVAKVDTTNATDLSYMFNGCSGLEEVILTWFNTASASNMRNMFANCTNLKRIYTTDAFVTTSVTSDSSMFSGCNSLTGQYGTTLASISEIDPSHVNDSTYARLDTIDAPGYFIYGTPAPKPVPPAPVPPTPAPPHGPSGGGSGGGGGVGGTIAGPLVDPVPNKINVNKTKVIKDAFNSSTCVWSYDPINDKWQLRGTNAYGQDVEASDGFYAIASLNDKPNNGIPVGEVVVDTYYFDTLGNMYTGWLTTIDNKTYFFENAYTMREGIMAIGWLKIMTDWYYFTADGEVLKNTMTPDGYLVGIDGKWMQS